MKAIPINCTKDDSYRYILEFLNPIFKLRSRELDVYAQLLYWNWIYREYDEHVKQKLVFDYDTTIKIIDRLEMTRESFDNKISRLRAAGFIKGRTLAKNYVDIIENNSDVLAFKFIITDGVVQR
jgi:hypothetical protein